MAPVRQWFRPKRVGWGWTPASWEGWAVTLVVLLAIAGSAVLAAAQR